MKRLVLGDNLAAMRAMPDESVDLIYLDPPFFSNRHYEVIWGDAGEIRSFEDRWAGGMMHYIGWLRERVQEMHRILKPTGSIYLHCDWHANAYIRVHILDPIFGANNLRNEIVWGYGLGGSPRARGFNQKHDCIYLYGKSEDYSFHPIRGEITEAMQAKYCHEDENGRYMMSYGKKYYMKGGKLIGDVWDDIPTISPTSGERIGYPTQKPEKLLERIILSSSNEGDIVLDPFVGGGTTIAVAERLGRQWIGIDQSVAAIMVSEHRLANMSDLLSGESFETVRAVHDYDVLFNMDPFKFQEDMVRLYGGIPNARKVGDKGVDGSLDGVPIQVKQSEGVGRNVIDNLKAAAERYDRTRYENNKTQLKPVAHLIAFSFGKGALEEVARLRVDEGVHIVLRRVDSILPIAHKPKLSPINISTTEDGKTVLDVNAMCDDGIAIFSWDLNYDPNVGIFKPEIFIDRDGHAEVALKSGKHCIAVRAVSNAGLSAIEATECVVQ